jgi:hypothetical protein
MRNIKMDVKTQDWVPRSHLTQGWDKWLAVVNTLMNTQVPQNVVNLSTSLETVRFSHRALLHTLRIKHDLDHSRCRCNIKPKILQQHTRRNVFILTSNSLFFPHKVMTSFHCEILGCDASTVYNGSLLSLLRFNVSAATSTCP